MNQDNFFRHVEIIEARDAKSLALKIKSIKQTFQINEIWSDGKMHYALINPGRKLPAKVLEDLAKDPR